MRKWYSQHDQQRICDQDEEHTARAMVLDTHLNTVIAFFLLPASSTQSRVSGIASKRSSEIAPPQMAQRPYVPCVSRPSASSTSWSSVAICPSREMAASRFRDSVPPSPGCLS